LRLPATTNKEPIISTMTSLPGSHTFIVRVWREPSNSASQWRGQIEHVQSGQRCAFLKLSDMLDFMDRFAVLDQGEKEDKLG